MKLDTDPRTWPPFWQFLQDWLRVNGWTQTRLADQLGAHQTVVSKWLHADPRRRILPGPRYDRALAALLGITRDQLDVMVHKDRLAKDETVQAHLRAGLAAALSADADDEINSGPDPVDQVIRARTAEMREAIRDIPHQFWWTVLNATFDRAIGGARDMAQLLAEAETASAPISDPAEAPIETVSDAPITFKQNVDGGLPGSDRRLLLAVGVR